MLAFATFDIAEKWITHIATVSLMIVKAINAATAASAEVLNFPVEANSIPSTFFATIMQHTMFASVAFVAKISLAPMNANCPSLTLHTLAFYSVMFTLRLRLSTAISTISFDIIVDTNNLWIANFAS